MSLCWVLQIVSHIYKCTLHFTMLKWLKCPFIFAAAPANITDVMINLNSVNVVNDGDGDAVSFTLSWNEPFANFDPIVKYTVTIDCTNITRCPAVFIITTTSVSVNFITDLSVMTSIQVTANNTIGESNPATIVIVGT